MSYVTQEDWKKAILAHKFYEQDQQLAVYADWLDERCANRSEPGWPQTFEGGFSAQGYLIRLGFAIGEMEKTGKDKTPECADLYKQRRQYITAFNEALSKIGVTRSLSNFIIQRKPLDFNSGLADHLHLSNSGISDTDLETLSWYRPLWSVRSVDLTATNVTDAGLVALNRFEGLEEIKASSHLTNEGIRTICTKAPYRDKLSLLWVGGRRVTNESVFYIMNLPNLKHLSLDGTSIDQRGFEQLIDSPNAKNLSFLMITNMEHLLPDGPNRPNHINNLELSLRVLDSDLKDNVKTQVLGDLRLFKDRTVVETMLRRARDEATDISLIR